MTALTTSALISGLAALAVGAALGVAYFRAVRRSVSLYVAEGRPARAAAFTLLRIAAAGVVLVLAARLGPAVLIGSFCGFLLARFGALRKQGAT